MKIIWDLDGTLFNTWDAHVSALRKVEKCLKGRKSSLLKIMHNQANTIDRTLSYSFGNDCFHEAQMLYKRYFLEEIEHETICDSIYMVEFIHKHLEYENVIFTGRDEQTSAYILDHFNIRGCFTEIHCVVGADSDKNKEIRQRQGIFHNGFYITDDEKEYIHLKDASVIFILAAWYKKTGKYKRIGYEVDNLESLNNLIANYNLNNR